MALSGPSGPSARRQRDVVVNPLVAVPFLFVAAPAHDSGTVTVIGRDVATGPGPVAAIEYLDVDGSGRDGAEATDVSLPGHRHRHRRRVIVPVAVLAIAGAIVAGTAMARQSSQVATRTSFFGGEPLPRSVSSAAPEEAWRYAAPRGRRTRTIQSAGHVVVATVVSDGAEDAAPSGSVTLVAFDGRRGRTLWSRDVTTDSGAGSVAATSPDAVVFVDGAGSSSPAVVAVDASTGHERWRIPGDHVQSVFIVPSQADRVLLVHPPADAGRGESITSVRVSDGGGAWSTALQAVAISGRAFVVAVDDVVRALDATSGLELWRQEPPADAVVLTELAGGPDVVLVARGDRLSALDARTGHERWGRSMLLSRDGFASSPIVLRSGTSVVGTHDEIVGLDHMTGADLWRVSARVDEIDSIRVGATERLLAFDNERVSTLDAVTGRTVATLTVSWPPVYSAESVYAISATGDLIGAPLTTLVPAWHVSLDGGVVAPSLLAIDRSVVVLDRRGVVRAVR